MTKDLTKKAKFDKLINALFNYSVLIIATLTILLPLYFVLITSFKSKAEALNVEFSWWPKEFSLHGYKEVFAYMGGEERKVPVIVSSFFNTILTVLPPTIISVLVSALAAYSFSKLKFKSKKWMFTVLLGTMMIPGTITMIPSYIIFDKIGWIDTYYPLIIPSLFGGAGTVFFLRQFFYSIPSELLEAARVDGLNSFKIFFVIMLPLSTPALIAQFVMNFVSGYNAYMGPLLYLHSPEKYTLQIALAFFQNSYGTDWAVVMAGAFVSLLPTVLMYLFGQKYFIEGIATSGLKV